MSNLSFDIGDMNYHNQSPKEERNTSTPNNNWIKKVCLIVIAAAVIAAAVWGITKIFDGGTYGDSESSDESENYEDGESSDDAKSYEKTAEAFLDQFMHAMIDGKLDEKKLKKQYPKFMGDTVEEICSTFREEYESFYLDIDDEDMEMMEDFFNYIEISFKTVDKEPMEKEELEEYQEDIRDFIDNDDEKINVQAGYQITMRCQMKLTKEGIAVIAEKEGLDEEELIEEMEKEFGEEWEEVLEEVLEEEWEEIFGDLNLVVLKCNKKIGVWEIDGNYIWDKGFIK